jgi:branched-chain amino acid aminotransferase
VIAISIDGQLVAPDHATVSVLDRGFLYGDGLFEVLRTWDGIAVDLDAHLDRLYTSASWLQLKTIDRAALAQAVLRTIASAQTGGGATDLRIRVVLTRGPGAIGTRLAELGIGRAIVIVEPLPAQPTELALALVDWPLARHTSAGHKTLAYLDHVIARELAAAAGADEAVRLDAAGAVVEGATSNLFVVIAGRVTTPPVETGALPGITRGRVLACCAELGLPAATERVSVEALRGADEVFVTSALRGVVGATRLDGETRALGPVTQRLASAYIAMMLRK